MLNTLVNTIPTPIILLFSEASFKDLAKHTVNRENNRISVSIQTASKRGIYPNMLASTYPKLNPYHVDATSRKTPTSARATASKTAQ